LPLVHSTPSNYYRLVCDYAFAFPFDKPLTLALVVAAALLPTCLAQEVASVDPTKIEARVDLRSPRATSPITGRNGGSIQQRYPCRDSAHSGVALRASLVSLDRTHYQVGKKSKFEVTAENTGSGPIRTPFSPHLADFQPKDPPRSSPTRSHRLSRRSLEETIGVRVLALAAAPFCTEVTIVPAQCCRYNQVNGHESSARTGLIFRVR